MEILKLDIVGSYYYKPDFEIISYDLNHEISKDCAICKNKLIDPSSEQTEDNTLLNQDDPITIGKCGHIFHLNCLNKWMEQSVCCPIDQVKWCPHTIADTTTKLICFKNKSRNRKKNKKN